MKTSSDHQAIVRDDSELYVKAAAVVEYEWPVNSGDIYFIEEYLVKFLEIKSLRRSYPFIERRKVQSSGEREFLMEKRVVTELQWDLGVVAIHEKQVYDFILPDFKEKFDIYNGMKLQKYYEDMAAEVMVSQVGTLDSSVKTVDDLKSCAMKACASWNAKTNDDSNKLRFTYLDKQTRICHKRKRQQDRNCDGSSKIGKYPLAVLPGQYVDPVPRFSSEYLKRLPLNTVLVDPNSPFEIPGQMEDISNTSTNTFENTDDDETEAAWPTPECSSGNTEKIPSSSSSSTITCVVSDVNGDSTDTTTCDTLFEELMNYASRT